MRRAPVEPHQRQAIAQHHQGTSRATGAAGGRWPIECGTVRLGRVGGRQHHGGRHELRVQRRVGHIASRSQAIDRPRQCELGGAEAGNEVAAAHLTALLQHLQHAVRRRVPAFGTLGQHCLSGDHAVPLEQLQRGGVSRLRWRWGRRAERRDERPATGTGRRPDARQAPRPRPAARSR